MKKTIHDPSYLEMVARLRTAREMANLSQRELASRVGKPQSYISKIEACERRVDLVETLELCAVLNIHLDKIIPSSFQRLIK